MFAQTIESCVAFSKVCLSRLSSTNLSLDSHSCVGSHCALSTESSTLAFSSGLDAILMCSIRKSTWRWQPLLPLIRSKFSNITPHYLFLFHNLYCLEPTQSSFIHRKSLLPPYTPLITYHMLCLLLHDSASLLLWRASEKEFMLPCKSWAWVLYGGNCKCSPSCCTEERINIEETNPSRDFCGYRVSSLIICVWAMHQCLGEQRLA